jgi:hypothetical protein
MGGGERCYGVPTFRLLGQIVQLEPRQFIAIASAVPVEGSEGASVLMQIAPSREEGLKTLGVMLDQLREQLANRGDTAEEPLT